MKAMHHFEKISSDIERLRKIVSRDMMDYNHWNRLDEERLPVLDVYDGRYSNAVLVEDFDGNHLVAKYDYDDKLWKETSHGDVVGGIVAWKYIENCRW